MNDSQPTDDQGREAHEPDATAAAGESAGVAAAPLGTPALDEQIAALAAHVRRLGQRLLSTEPLVSEPPVTEPPLSEPPLSETAAAAPAGWIPGDSYASATPVAEERPQAARTVAQSPHAATSPGRWDHLRAPQPAAPPFTTGESILAMAEAAADEIRASAEREAQRIREVVANDASERVAELLAIIASQCESVAGLTAEAERIEHSAVVLREQARALEADLQVMLSAVSAVARTDR
jgi:hypothetical protein